jgi:DNA-binding transcriptional ArsR family regulator
VTTQQRRQATESEANALASGIRLRIIRLTRTEALTNQALAQRLGRDPATVLHHVRKLVDNGFLEPQPPRKGNRGAKEIPYLSTGKSWTLSVPRDRSVAEAMVEAYLAEVGELNLEHIEQTRAVLDLPLHRRDEFERRLGELIEEFKTTPARPGGDRVAIYVAMYASR